MADNKTKINLRIRELREGGVVLSQRELGLLMGLSHTTISRHESGERFPTREELRLYARVFKVDTHDLFFESPKSDEDDHKAVNE